MNNLAFRQSQTNFYVVNATDQSDFASIGVGAAANADDDICPAYDIGVQTEALLQSNKN